MDLAKVLVLILFGVNLLLSGATCEKYFHGSRYIFYESNGTQYNWDGSKKICNEQSGSNLVSIESPEEWNFLKETIQKQNTTEYFIGLWKDTSTGVWRWLSDNSTVNASNQGEWPWAEGEPNNVQENCTQMYRNYRGCHGRYNDVSCTSPIAGAGFICELTGGAPSSAPIINKQETKAEDAHTIRVKWNEIKKEDQNGLILRYEVSYKENGTEKVLGFNITKTNTIITDLKPLTSYCIQVRGFTSVGKSLLSPCFHVQTLDKGPSHPFNVKVQAVSSVSILVTWDKPAHSNGDIKEYIIFYGTREDVQSNERKVTGNTRERIIDGLNKYTTYYVKVRGSASTPGNASEILNATTFEDSPGPPREFRAQVVIANNVYLTWKEPDSSNGIVRFYDIRICDNITGLQVIKVGSQSADVQSDIQQHSRLIKRLEYYTDYTFTIQAVTIKPGEMANATARTEEGAPSQPRDVTAKLDKGELSATVTWKDPKNHNGIIIIYTVYLEGKRAHNNSFHHNHEIVLNKSSRSTEIRIEKLKPGTKYSVYVKAKTAKGYGTASDPVMLDTPSKLPVVTKDNDLMKDILYLPIAILAGLLFIVMIILAMVLILLRKKQQEIDTRNKVVKMNQGDFQESWPLNVLKVGARLEFASGSGTGIERLHRKPLVQQEGVYTELFPESMMTSENDGSRTYASLVKSTEDSDNEYVNQLPAPEYVNAC